MEEDFEDCFPEGQYRTQQAGECKERAGEREKRDCKGMETCGMLSNAGKASLLRKHRIQKSVRD